MEKREIKKWKETGMGNTILSADWGRISYNKQTGNGHLGSMITDLINIIEGEDSVVDGEETALYDGEIWRILTGDFRKEYESAFPILKKCIEVYEKHKEKSRNNYSTD